MGRRIYLCRKRTVQRGGCRIWLQKRGGAERGVQAAVGSRGAGEGRRSRLGAGAGALGSGAGAQGLLQAARGWFEKEKVKKI
ncbi:hypothetical protein SLEP1_g35371 [Rubroshorea leprosula]|uniref:Uncharacterized protein n=1 Tax=Rubroshorea leprosula TaxID=152421 RepID=A0AAV5KN03_9ROSI|nr:hypothetical protein SLEP1_g35371 [Rubroshorea leprosula]